MSSTNSIVNNPAFAAYTYMTLVLPKELEHSGVKVDMKAGPQISFADFEKEIQSDKPVNQSYAGIAPDLILNNLQTNQRLSSRPAFEAEVASLVQKAYQLGMVDPKTHLLTPNVEATA